MSKNPKLINNIDSVNKILKEIELVGTSTFGTGGMKSKIMAAKKAINAGCCVGIIKW